MFKKFRFQVRKQASKQPRRATICKYCVPLYVSHEPKKSPEQRIKKGKKDPQNQFTREVSRSHTAVLSFCCWFVSFFVACHLLRALCVFFLPLLLFCPLSCDSLPSFFPRSGKHPPICSPHSLSFSPWTCLLIYYMKIATKK